MKGDKSNGAISGRKAGITHRKKGTAEDERAARDSEFHVLQSFTGANPPRPHSDSHLAI